MLTPSRDPMPAPLIGQRIGQCAMARILL